MSGPRVGYMSDKVHLDWLTGTYGEETPVEPEPEDRAAWGQGAGHCPTCSLDYELAEALTGRRSQSDQCSLCEQEEGLQ